MADDESTLTYGPDDSLTGSSGFPQVPALTIIWHPDLDRVGQIAPLTSLIESGLVHLSRDQPIFLPPGSTAGEPLDHRGISLQHSVLDIVYSRGTLELRRADPSGKVEIDREPLGERRRVSAEDLQRGLIIRASRHFVFCLHAVHLPISRSTTLGLIGTSDGIEDARRSIIRVARKNTPVLLRGESGTGKELAAKAIHAAGVRPRGPFVAVNMATLGAERAVAALFGHTRGAFTGAAADHAGKFRSADGGTIFLDEIGETPREVQPMLLRVLDDQVIDPLGSSKPMKVDVRIIAATDAKLERAVLELRFELSLYNRLNSAVVIYLPPLRERREDIGSLLVNYLREGFGDNALLQRLQDPDRPGGSWLSARDVATVAVSPLSGNVRSIIGLARQLVTEAGEPPRDTHELVKKFLARKEPIATSDPEFAVPAGRAVVTKEQLLIVLERANWNHARAAKILGVARSTVWRWITNDPELLRIVEERSTGTNRKS